MKQPHPFEVLPSMASLPGLLQQISDRDLLLKDVLVKAGQMDAMTFYCWLQQDFVPNAKNVLKLEIHE